MADEGWPGRLGTRGEIMALLRRGRRTVDELADAIGITDNAVRLHLTALERGGLVRAAGVRREGSVGKPATEYVVAPEADSLYSRAYEPVLTTLLVTLAGRFDPAELTELLRDVGRQLASTVVSRGATLEARVRDAAGVLVALGGDCEVVREGRGYRVRGFACPLSESVRQCPAVCAAAESLVAGIVGDAVEEACDRGERPACSFLVTPGRDA